MSEEGLAQWLHGSYASNDERLRAKFCFSLFVQMGLPDSWERVRRQEFDQDTITYNCAPIFGLVEVGIFCRSAVASGSVGAGRLVGRIGCVGGDGCSVRIIYDAQPASDGGG